MRVELELELEVDRFLERWKIEMSDSKSETDNKNLSMKCGQKCYCYLAL